jgi:hypothetical protein
MDGRELNIRSGVRMAGPPVAGATGDNGLAGGDPDLGSHPIATSENSDRICQEVWYNVVGLHCELTVGYTPTRTIQGAGALSSTAP